MSYFLGNDPAQWRPEVPVYGSVRYDELYPGIDLVLGGDQDGVLPWSLEARPGAKSSTVRLRVEGADSATLDGRLLRIATAAASLRCRCLRPLAFRSKRSGHDGSLLSFNASREQWMAAQARGISQRAPADNPADLLYGTFLGGSAIRRRGHGGGRRRSAPP